MTAPPTIYGPATVPLPVAAIPTVYGKWVFANPDEIRAAIGRNRSGFRLRNRNGFLALENPKNPRSHFAFIIWENVGLPLAVQP